MPVVRNLVSGKSPFEIFRALYGRGRKAFFFDSHAYLPPKQIYSYIGVDPFLEVTVRGTRISVGRAGKVRTYPRQEIFSVLRKIFARYRLCPNTRLPFFCGGAVGFWAYEMAPECDRIRLRAKPGAPTPDLFLGFYRDVIAYDHRKRLYRLVSLYEADGRFSRRRAEERLNCLGRAFKERPGGGAEDAASFSVCRFRAEMKRPVFEAMVRRAKDYIAAGDIYQANLSQRFSFDYSGNPAVLYGRLRKINPSPFAAFLDTGTVRIISSSPERLVRKRGRHVETCPIAGTRPSAKAGAPAVRMAKSLKASLKERAEHVMLVDLERNDLGRVCDWPTVRVRDMMAVEKYSHVMHLVSKITGRLSRAKDALDLVRAMFPGGTITGCPKIRCMEIIDELEPVARGIYTGSLGYLGFDGDMDLNIVIRTLVLCQHKGFLQAGAGIVYDSNPRREYEETLHKAEALIKALQTKRDR
ncbi:MAG: anthranilate synthase component I family protein [Candidatus Omnitrophota bacterium]|jgi:para-aminobenzoate synthetase component 1